MLQPRFERVRRFVAHGSGWLAGAHDIAQAVRTPARRIAASARSPSPGWRSTARTASSARVTDAVVGRKTSDGHRADTTLAEAGFEGRAIRAPAGGVANGEARVAVFAASALAHDPARYSQIGVQFGAPGVLNTVDRPEAAVLLEMGRVGRCQSCV